MLLLHELVVSAESGNPENPEVGTLTQKGE